jgi:hypothetical protein
MVSPDNEMYSCRDILSMVEVDAVRPVKRIKGIHK